MENYWQLGRWARIPVAMHWTVLIAFAWLYLLFMDLLSTLIGSAAFFALLVAHEFGHVAVLRRRKIAVESVTFYGIHGRTAHGYANTADEILIAWGGVAAQAVVLALALAGSYLLTPSLAPWVWIVAGPVLLVFTKLNVFLMIIALLPIGPFDGQSAWRAIPWIRGALRRRRKSANSAKAIKLTPEQRRELEESSEKAAADLIEKLAKKK